MNRGDMHSRIVIFYLLTTFERIFCVSFLSSIGYFLIRRIAENTVHKICCVDKGKYLHYEIL
jgi:hypothetical protein